MRKNDLKDRDKDIFAMDYNEENEPIKPKKKNTAFVLAIAALLMMGSSVIYSGIQRESTEKKAQEAQRQNIGSMKNNASSIIEMIDKVNEETKTSDEQSTPQNDTVAKQVESEIILQDEVRSDDETQVQSVSSPQVFVAVKPLSELLLSMAYSYQTDPVFSTTLNEYRSDHTGSDYSAKVDEEVYAVAKGKVTNIYEDSRYGVTVTLDHGDGIKTEYSNLQSNTAVLLNQNVEAGTVIGRIGNSALYEMNDAPHLHFSVKLDDEYVDPQRFLRSE